MSKTPLKVNKKTTTKTTVSAPAKVKSDLPTPLQDRLVITKLKPEEQTAGGIIIPSASIEEIEDKGIVLAVGPLVGKLNLETAYTNVDIQQIYPKVGDLVSFSDTAGHEISHNGKEYLILKERDILCIL